ncbi:MAG: GNAT family N-acetyltransferase [Anaerolineae bacterium]|nr:GNAT family N-acetyltransferase [Anaerolineae bacterium]
MEKTNWPPGFTVRPPRPDEAQAVAELIIAGDLADFGEPEWSLEDTVADWGRLGFDLARDARVVVAPDGALVAYADVHRRPNAVQVNENSTLNPDYTGRGLEETFYALIESLAAQHAPLPVQWIMEANQGHVLAGRGYAPVRWFWQMRICFAGPPDVPEWPDEYSVRLMREEDQPATHALIETAFTRPDRAPVSLAEWRRFMVERDDYDPSLFFVAVRGDEIAGACLSIRYAQPDEGWVRQLAVEEKHRGRGLGRALLLHAFGEFHRRGAPRVGLGVDAKNPSATKLYLGVGMRAHREYVQYQKPAPVG